ncbi:hypothetical protein SCHPADRAFT_699199 [Schizopora paradoxa]|uniref:Uncharacterized protein n=1 Tax=Schizopora paradoxa TaxID=27342 RepID=A0A0H2R2V6_9AGAM|nr:hypothetical protein SCHPADRAFT_699199 [Schizopora paradoxa]
MSREEIRIRMIISCRRQVLLLELALVSARSYAPTLLSFKLAASQYKNLTLRCGETYRVRRHRCVVFETVDDLTNDGGHSSKEAENDVRDLKSSSDTQRHRSLVTFPPTCTLLYFLIGNQKAMKRSLPTAGCCG